MPFINVREAPYNATGNGNTDDTAAFNAAFNTVRNAGGGKIVVPKGIYRINSSLNIEGCQNMIFEGEGPENTIFWNNVPNGWHMFQDMNGVGNWRTFRDFSITSLINRTGGAFFYFNFEKRGLIDRVKMTSHFDGVNYYGFEQSEMRSVSITTPSGNGTAVIAGHVKTGGLSGVNLLLNSCFFRGFNDTTQDPGSMVGWYGLYARDCNAIFAVNTDWSAFYQTDVQIDSQNLISDHYFSQCFFDSTSQNHCFALTGPGLKEKVTFTGCWFGGAGQFGTSANSNAACGFFSTQPGVYSDIQFTGNRFYANKGAGLFMSNSNADFLITGNTFNTNGQGGNGNQQGGIMWAPPANPARGPLIVANRFKGNTGGDVRFSNECQKHVVTNNYFSTGKQGGGNDSNITNNYTY